MQEYDNISERAWCIYPSANVISIDSQKAEKAGDVAVSHTSR